MLVLSDLHREVWRDLSAHAQDALAAVRPDPSLSQPDVVILAGDIDVGIGAITWADSAFPNIPVIYVSGNH
ncbi:metallophosphoesterase [Stenotrophomonas rhizophila]|uniref:metallophosphoesterase n=1 Tax=Stenotrophomonas rhizophila TaxID=216778 RepID=UPI003D18DF6A